MKVAPFLLILTTGLLTPEIMLTAIFLWSCGALAKPTVGIAQVTSDGTTNTIVNPSGNNFNILNGIEKSNNLFHSFSNFSVPTGGSAKFDLTNTPNITTIFSRVTGGNISNIDGEISANGSANLFLINPAGIIFGKDASLNIGGSFVGTTANSIKFADGTEFSAVNPMATTLLTMSVPIGLQMGRSSGDIQVEGVGNSTNITRIGLSLLNITTPTTGLQVKSGNTLSLVASNVTIDGGLLIANSGKVELGALSNGQWLLGENNQLATVSTTPTTEFGDIQLRAGSLVNVSGINAGFVQLNGGNITLQDGSVIAGQNFGQQLGGNIQIIGSESLSIIGATSTIPSQITTQALGLGKGGDINLSAPQIMLQNGGIVAANTFSAASSGTLSINAPLSVQLTGTSPFDPSALSALTTTTFSQGNAGSLTLSTGTLTVRGGAQITSTTLGFGNAGQVSVNATELIDLAGTSLVSNSAIVSTSFGAGDGGTTIINTPKLRLDNGGAIITTAFSSGNAGKIIINAEDAIEMANSQQLDLNTANSNFVNTQITSSVTAAPAILQLILGLPEKATGNAGSVSINTSTLNMDKGAVISVENRQTGEGGQLEITADFVTLKNSSRISALTTSGNGGDINLDIQKALLLSQSSQISTTAGGLGNGGNITISSPIILGLENSDIIANAAQGRGGNIQISTQGIIALEYRNTLTPRADLTNDITASSQFGLSGTVDINNFGVDPSSGLVELPENVTDSSKQIATGCFDNTGSSFVATGRGGLPQNPNQQTRRNVYDSLHLSTWSDIRDISAYRGNSASAQIPQSAKSLISATSWHRNTIGKIELIADKSPIQVQQSLTCAAVPKS
ncbi:S-layer family protein [Anabaena cylindrica FACHB-243]|uniref:Filamentous hemagglutinin family outer membrane protein n=1 Tax=Anabaena cylindrica (strain ATCC 27899 / PCC 7122) TaxID=272123 RepID=K9ZCJ7_ANACC|nr:MULTISPECIES: S-layer family protein [Anabaena]AFZ56317.1 filamentous hemagglutinin family outer membrane protein [Anabaena cylindrica PCC 7122]MBD2420327.1 S-layer family protein [Anabaena cylindrica FACHB-243]MCM2407719.1 S-layer family protein [Anabaena sp. CCAP 1446/1C]BAY01243.1 filamentous hemagglutinin family outer membrane protein [Anabaena cylindrica PCC 7122]